MIETSSGTATPVSRSAFIAPIASRSLAQNMAVNHGRRSVSRGFSVA